MSKKVRYKITTSDESGQTKNCFATNKKELSHIMRKVNVDTIEDLTNYYSKLGVILEKY